MNTNTPNTMEARDDRQLVTCPSESDRYIDLACNPQKFAASFRDGREEDRQMMVSEIELMAEHRFTGFVQFVLPAVIAVMLNCCTSLQLALGQKLLSVNIRKLPSQLGRQLSHAAMQIIEIALKTESLQTQPAVMGRLVEVYGEVLYLCIPTAEWSTTEVRQIIVFYDSLCTPVAKAGSRIVTAINVISSVSMSKVEEPFFALEVVPRILTVFLAVKRVQPRLSGFVAKKFAFSLSGMTDRSFGYLHARVWTEIIRIWTSPADGQQPAESKKDAIEAAIVMSRFAMQEAREQRDFSALFESIFNYVMGFARREVSHAQQDEYEVLLALAKEFGQLTHTLPNPMLKRGCIDAFCTLSRCSDTSIRQSCAFNLPKVASLFAGEDEHRRILLSVIQVLADDITHAVRLAVAEGFHEMIRSLANLHAEELLVLLNGLLTDEEPDVRVSVTKNLSSTLEILRDGRGESLQSPHVDISLLGTATKPECRAGKVIAEQSGLLASFLSQAQKTDDLAPLLLGLFCGPFASVRRAAGKAFIGVVRSINNIDVQKAVIETFYSQARARGYKQKLAIVDSLLTAFEEFSRHFYCELFAPELLQMASDVVTDVRLKVALNLHKVAPACQMIPRYSTVMQSLSKDGDPHVREAMLGFVMRASDYIRRARESGDEDTKKLRQELLAYESMPTYTAKATGLFSRKGKKRATKSTPESNSASESREYCKNKQGTRRGKTPSSIFRACFGLRKHAGRRNGFSDPDREQLSKNTDETEHNAKGSGSGSGSGVVSVGMKTLSRLFSLGRKNNVSVSHVTQGEGKVRPQRQGTGCGTEWMKATTRNLPETLPQYDGNPPWLTKHETMSLPEVK